MKITKPTPEELQQIDLTPFDSLIAESRHKEHFFREPGKDHYKLLAYISTKLKKGSTFIDLGTHKGLSALAASYNKDVKVITYDITDEHIEPKVIDRPNIEFKLKSGLEDLKTISKASFIFLDVDPHDGAQEREYLKQIIESGYKGMILCDDIHLNDGMRDFWRDVNETKEDWTDMGHYSGTGVIIIG